MLEADGVPHALQKLWLGPARRHGRCGRGLVDHAEYWLLSKTVPGLVSQGASTRVSDRRREPASGMQRLPGQHSARCAESASAISMWLTSRDGAGGPKPSSLINGLGKATASPFCAEI